MMPVLVLLKSLPVALGVFSSWFWGGINALVYVLIVLIVVDYISEIMCGFITKELNSVVGVKAISQKLLIILLVGVSNIVDIYLIRSDNAPLRTTVTFFYITHEGISLLENAAIIGLPVPEVLKNALMKNHKEEHDPEENDP